MLDPLAPLCWRGLALWPDGLGPALADAEADNTEALVEIIAAEIQLVWAGSRVRGDVARAGAGTRQHRAMLRAEGGARQLAYVLNPLLPCASKLLAGRILLDPAELVGALEERASRNTPGTTYIDFEIAAWIAARSEHRTHAELAAALSEAGAATAPALLAQLQLLAALQQPGTRAPRPAQQVVAAPDALLAGWRSPAKRRELAARLAALAEAGELAPILALATDAAERAADKQDAHAAARDLARIEAELARIEAGGATRAAVARDLGQEAAAGLALAALALSMALAVFG